MTDIKWKNINDEFYGDIAATILRFLWKVHLNTTISVGQVNDLLCSEFKYCLRSGYGSKFDEEAKCELDDKVDSSLSHTFDERSLEKFRSMSFNEHVADLNYPAVPDKLTNFIQRTFQEWKPTVINIHPQLIHSVKDIDQQYMEWLGKHLNVLDKIAWEAFEKVVAEIFASRGFHVDITSNLRNMSADIIAVRYDEFGVETKYLIECKRFGRSRHIGIDIVNGVIGASRRADIDHAFLVTSSYFTRDVTKRKSEFKQLRLHLRDGDDVKQWLQDYTVRTEGGLWLSPRWDAE